MELRNDGNLNRNFYRKPILILLAVFVLYASGCSVPTELPPADQPKMPTELPRDQQIAKMPDTSPAIKLVYPENFFIPSGKPIDYGALAEPAELFYYVGLNAIERILDYGIVMVYSEEYGGQEHFYETSYKDARFVTSENISVGSTKEEVLRAYRQYGITDVVDGYKRNIGGLNVELEEYMQNGVQNYSAEELRIYNWLIFIKLLAEERGNINTDQLLYVDNGTPEGIEQFGGLGAWIFVFDDNDILQMIIITAPTSG
jgi:hypothetical protein